LSPSHRQLSRHEALAVRSRRDLLELLERRGAMDAGELADSLDLHVTTVRFHLAALAGAGLVIASPASGGRPGRPRLLYRPATPSGEESTGYQTLAGILAAHLADDEVERGVRAEAAGRAWAAERVRLDDGSAASASLDVTAVLVVDRFAAMGFAPAYSVAHDVHRIEMRSCPYRALAEQHPEVTCSLHRGLLRGLLDTVAVGAPALELVPFAGPDYCLARIAPDPAALRA
jgi:predicted ArsR family transcriptional regulator